MISPIRAASVGDTEIGAGYADIGRESGLQPIFDPLSTSGKLKTIRERHVEPARVLNFTDLGANRYTMRAFSAPLRPSASGMQSYLNLCTFWWGAPAFMIFAKIPLFASLGFCLFPDWRNSKKPDMRIAQVGDALNWKRWVFLAKSEHRVAGVSCPSACLGELGENPIILAEMEIEYPARRAIRPKIISGDDGYDRSDERAFSPSANVLALYCPRGEGGDFAPPIDGMGDAGCLFGGYGAYGAPMIYPSNSADILWGRFASPDARREFEY